jgi:hypothetical protein
MISGTLNNLFSDEGASYFRVDFADYDSCEIILQLPNKIRISSLSQGLKDDGNNIHTFNVIIQAWNQSTNSWNTITETGTHTPTGTDKIFTIVANNFTTDKLRYSFAVTAGAGGATHLYVYPMNIFV